MAGDLAGAVDPAWRRRGLAALPAGQRLARIAAPSDAAYRLADARKLASVALPERFGFVELARSRAFSGVTFEGDQGVPFRAKLRALGDPHRQPRRPAVRPTS